MGMSVKIVIGVAAAAPLEVYSRLPVIETMSLSV
jgi:hypothetical protein